MNMFLTVIMAILMFSVIIFVHEFGHFIAARIFGVNVHEFAIGMGPAIWKKQGKRETVYSVRAFPLGGFCQMEGEDEESDSPGAFNNKKPVPRMVILVAGVAMNLLLGFLIVLGLTTTTAISQGGLSSTVVEAVNPESSASFLQPGDKIVAVNGKTVHIQRDLSFELSKNGNKEATLTVKRNGEKFAETFTPMVETQEDGSTAYLVGFNIAIQPVTVGGILHESFFQTVWMGKLVFESLGMLLSGEAGVQDMSGPVGVVHTMNTVAQTGFLSLLFFGAFLAVNIGLMNLLPLPALDGGRLLFVLVELIFRKPVPRDKEGWIHLVGLALLLLLMVYVTWNDLVRIFSRA